MKLSKLEIFIDRNGVIHVTNEELPYDKPDTYKCKCFGGSTNSFVYYPTDEKDKYKELLINYSILKAQEEISKNTKIIEQLMEKRL